MLPVLRTCLAGMLTFAVFSVVHAAPSNDSYQLPQGIQSSQIVNGYLNGYQIGNPPPGSRKHPQLYITPGPFIEVTADNANNRVSPHFTLDQFLCKQKADFPKYIVLQGRLLILLEGLIGAVREVGYPVETFGVISGYRTPYYNKHIGNVPNSRHIYGDALDFFIDLDHDGRMDDLNGNGKHDRADIDVLFEIVEAFKQQPENSHLVGGVGRYYQTSHHGGFIHVDTRGYKVRW